MPEGTWLFQDALTEQLLKNFPSGRQPFQQYHRPANEPPAPRDTRQLRRIGLCTSMAEPRECGVDLPLAQDASPGEASRRLPSPVGTPGSSLDARMRAGMLTADPSTLRPPAAKTAAEKRGGRSAQDDKAVLRRLTTETHSCSTASPSKPKHGRTPEAWRRQ
jgi:hypothetical protein